MFEHVKAIGKAAFTLFNLAYILVYVNIRIGLVSFILYLRSKVNFELK